MKKKKTGFTVVELLIVITMIGILVSITLSYSLRSQHRWTLRGVAREITSTYYQMRQQASRDNTPYRMEFLNGSFQTYRYDATTMNWVAIAKSAVTTGNIGTKVTIVNPPDFAVNSSGFIVKQNVPNQFSILGLQTIELTSPGAVGMDRIFILIYPYGGIQVESQFR